ncbi:MAG: sigma-70 family RNA polymerase sigma factor [Planctomycetes bacterium]|nr:sigma-70 family RNA polymerase sigma factor [Planctomycetota bacterium]
MSELSISADELIEKAHAGDMDAFAEIVRRYSPAVRAMCVMRAGDPHRADDISQQVFLTVWRRFREFTPGTSFWAWLETITRNHIYNEWRRIRRERGFRQRYTVAWLADNENELPEPDPELLECRLGLLRQCLEKLPTRLKEMIRLRYDECRSSDEMAEAFGNSSDSIRQTLLRVRERLRTCVESKLSAKGAE